MAETLTLVPLGVGAAYGRPDEAQSAYLVQAGDRAVCLDLGAGTFNRLCGAMRPEQLDALVITHLHPDHIADLLSLRVYMAWGPGRGSHLRVLGPPGLRELLVAFTDETGWDGLRFETLPPPEDGMDLGQGFVLRFVEVPHLLPTFAVRVDWEGKSFCYGADCAPNDVLPSFARGVDLLLLECSFGAGPAPEGVPHLTAQHAAELARQAEARRLLLTHCYPEFNRDEAIAAARAALGVPVEWAQAGQAVTA